MARGEYVEYNETANWNVAKVYAHEMIFRPLSDLNTYFTIAKFGVHDLDEGFSLNKNLKDNARFEALERIVFTLKMIIDNTIFAVNKKTGKPKLEKFYNTLDLIEDNLQHLKSETSNERTNETRIKIDAVKFSKFLKMLENIKRDLLVPLNDADLIFRSSEELDPDELMRKQEEDLIFAG